MKLRSSDSASPPAALRRNPLDPERRQCPKHTDHNMLDVLDRLTLTPEGRDLLTTLMSGMPVRDVQNQGGNVVTSVFSWKMGCEVRFEARTTEFALGQEKELNSNTVGFWPQAHRFYLVYQWNGKTVRTTHVPDVFSLEKFPARAVLEEIKTEAEWQRLALQRPGWVVKEGGRWRNPTLEDYFQRTYGYDYRLRSSEEFPAQRVDNYASLAAYYAPNAAPVSDAGYAEIREQFKVQSFVPLRAFVEAGVTVDDINKAIADGLVAFDFDYDDVDDTDHALIYRDQLALKMCRRALEQHEQIANAGLLSSLVPGSQLVYDGVTYVAKVVGNRKAVLVSEYGATELDLTEIVKMIQSGRAIMVDVDRPGEPHLEGMQLTNKQMRSAVAKLEKIRLGEEDFKKFTKSRRSLQRWQKQLRDAGPDLSDQLAAIAPKRNQSGNREERVSPALVAAFEKNLKSYNSTRAPNGSSSYKAYCLDCEKLNQRPISRSAFYKKLKKRKSIRNREGKRRAYQTDPIVLYLEHTVNVHGTRPMRYVHIDHTPIDIEIVDKHGKTLRTVWLTLAVDASSRAVVGFVLSFETPSYRSCMMVLRDIIRRFGRAPDMLVLDNGKEFKSNALRRLATLYQITLRYRPPSKSRFGSVMERMFGTTTTQLFNNLEGNKELLKYFRSVTKSFQPKNHARWTMPAIYGALEFYFTRLYGRENHPAHGEPPVSFFERRLTETGQRATRLVRYDRTFLIETCPSVEPKGTRIVDNQRGVKIGWIWYWSDVFSKANVDGKAAEIRVDPWDPRYVYALVEDHWELCRSKLVGVLRRMTAVELRHASQTIQTTAGVKHHQLSRERLKEWADVLKPELFDSRLHVEQQEMAYIFEPLGMTSVEFATNKRPADALVEAATKRSVGEDRAAQAHAGQKPSTAAAMSLQTLTSIKIDLGVEIETF
jgi:putative transposase